ncbi:hypothetical protein [Antarcticirhabdus aurantiaca]|uniref:Uncharacterized protein n=1 Tax=Antarcticirhabdus aurantiaca TaxID=2606717 RepID=A0ACD4NHA6_9HYPH|nr:hypothetical protein [Antarcticirhabdus aurantiaca]WAJ26186.1 hypothetical protein OXU80_14830 [Jeongeuplla avenae]
MKNLIAAALFCASLSACVTAQPDVALQPVARGPSPEEVRNDNHCRGLLMQPGTFVYVQCRLAMDGTQLKQERQFRARLESVGGPLTPDVENAMRADVICNFNEASKLSQQVGDAQALAYQALGKCRRQRGVLERTVATWLPGRFDALATYEQDAVGRNVTTINEARAFPTTPPPGAMAAAGAPGPGGMPGAGAPQPVGGPAVPVGQLAPMRAY